jgi:hypothetical protein
MMIKKLMILVAALIVVTTACRKERTCECEVTHTKTPASGGKDTSVVYTTKITKEKQRKKQFRYSEKCYEYSTTQTTSSPTFSGTEVYHHECKME